MTDGPRVVLRADRGKRIGAWAFTAFGVVVGLSALAANDLVAEVLMGLFGLMCVLTGPAAEIVRLTCDEHGLRYRAIFRAAQVLASDVTAMTVRSVPGYGNRRLRIDVERLSTRPLKLSELQRLDTPRNLARAEADADAIRRTLGLTAPAEGEPALRTVGQS